MQPVNRMRCGASAPDDYSRQPAPSVKPFGVNEGIEMSDEDRSSDRQDPSFVTPYPIMEAEQEMNKDSFSGVVSPLSALMWRTNILRPQAQCDPTRSEHVTVQCNAITLYMYAFMSSRVIQVEIPSTLLCGPPNPSSFPPSQPSSVWNRICTRI